LSRGGMKERRDRDEHSLGAFDRDKGKTWLTNKRKKEEKRKEVGRLPCGPGKRGVGDKKTYWAKEEGEGKENSSN